MKMNVKTFAVIAALVIMGGTSVFAQANEKSENSAITAVAQNEMKTSTFTVKVTYKKDVRIIYLTDSEGKTYVADADMADPESVSMMNAVSARKGKKIIVSGYLNKISNVFTIVKIGGIGPDGDSK